MVKSIYHKTLIPINQFIHYQHSGGIVLLLSVVLALIFANSPMRDEYHHFWDSDLRIAFNKWELNYTFHQWINDGLMAMFFFVVGLELKREIIIGELSTLKKAILPIAAAIGGMVVPALIYLFINKGYPSIEGWGIPMATDIVFTLALIGLVSKQVPLAAKIFLVALATVDDLGAIAVIAFFYSSHLSISNLTIGLILLSILLFANFIGIRNMFFYAIIGIGGIWLAFLLSGVHATIAGVLVAFTIPARTKLNELAYSENIRDLMIRFDKEIPQRGPLITLKQNELIEAIKVSSMDAQAPLQKLEIALHPWVTFLVIPLFALSNAGVEIGDN
ncbi:MAG TPA: Na+/H+ antiporter NhaA, partial [Gillisia sp.]|nr:Na+/H+ antiporter NhaA [Gillisia sp.]